MSIFSIIIHFLRQRTEGVGILPKEDAIKLGVTGSVLRASGVPYDIRKVEPYDVYDEIDFNVQYMKTCDSFARAYVPLFRYERILSYY